MSAQPEALRLADVSRLSRHHEWHLQVDAELRRLHALCAEWETKATAWLASPEAAKRLEGYRSLAERAANAETQRDVLLEVVQKFVAWSEAEIDPSRTTFWQRVEMCREVDALAHAAIALCEGPVAAVEKTK